MRELLRNRDARIYLGGQCLSLFGDASLWLAAGIWVKTLTHSNAKAGLVFFFFALASLTSPLAGMVVDRVRRRRVLISVNLAGAAVVMLLLLVHNASDVWLVYLVMVLYGMTGGLISSAQSAFLTVLLPEELLADANGLLTTVREGLRLVAPLVGAGLFVVAGGGAVAMIDAASFVVAAVATLALRIREPKPERVPQAFLTEVVAGFKHVLGTPVLRRLSASLAVALLVVGFGETVVFAVVATGLHRAPSFLGVLLAVQGVGALAGGPSAAPLVRRIGEPRLVAAGLALAAVGSALFASTSLVVVVAGTILFGAAIPWIVVGAFTLLQRLTPAEVQGRAFSAFDMLVSVPQTVSIGVGALLISVIGYRIELAAMAGVTTLAAVIMLLPGAGGPGLRHAAGAGDAAELEEAEPPLAAA
jgi:MFS family permease